MRRFRTKTTAPASCSYTIQANSPFAGGHRSAISIENGIARQRVATADPRSRTARLRRSRPCTAGWTMFQDLVALGAPARFYGWSVARFTVPPVGVCPDVALVGLQNCRRCLAAGAAEVDEAVEQLAGVGRLVDDGVGT
jgi:hypothetical protein